ncbi:hypothetical protein JG687_00016815 [Phytophthora cactorum]|uniref:RxLR effector protein n=1 Tax=Phytophthora cactorum TaxID=29920 RepID=A0A8T1TRC3_9STRA|nr:hypothetical protein JG687_00016815 [Phytophthora cactorum]
MRATYLILFATATILASISDASTVTDLSQTQLSRNRPVGVAQVADADSERSLTRRKTDAEDEDAEELLAAKLDDAISILPRLQTKTPMQLFEHLQQLRLPWEKREAILQFVSLDPAARKKVLDLIVKNAGQG